MRDTARTQIYDVCLQAIDSEEFKSFLASDAMAKDMGLDVFFEAMFQLADLWSARMDAVAYAQFLHSLFEHITHDGKLVGYEVDGGTEDGKRGYRLREMEEIHSLYSKVSGEMEMDGVELKSLKDSEWEEREKEKRRGERDGA